LGKETGNRVEYMRVPGEPMRGFIYRRKLEKCYEMTRSYNPAI
jgi:hypothetical protein